MQTLDLGDRKELIDVTLEFLRRAIYLCKDIHQIEEENPEIACPNSIRDIVCDEDLTKFLEKCKFIWERSEGELSILVGEPTIEYCVMILECIQNKTDFSPVFEKKQPQFLGDYLIPLYKAVRHARGQLDNFNGNRYLEKHLISFEDITEKMVGIFRDYAYSQDLHS